MATGKVRVICFAIIKIMMKLRTHHKVAAVLTLLFAPVVAGAADSPHWTKDGCQNCHVEAAAVNGAINLTAESAEALCENCHGDRGDALPCRHSSGIPVGQITIDESLRASLKNGRIECSTCHDIVYQCERPKEHFRLQNIGFLRERTSRKASDYCFKCHDLSTVDRLNPHDGVSGNPPRPTCNLCHDGIPGSSNLDGLNVAFNMQHDLNDACRGCHNVRPHPTTVRFSFGASESTEDWEHLVAPSEAVLANMRKAEAETGVVLPLSPVNGEVFCGTCHNQHGFMLGEGAASTQGRPHHRLRTREICQVCHDK
jgi:predicted CXXCH cytochrome family protein